MRKTKEWKHLSLKLKRWDKMDKMCELIKTLKDLKLTRNEIRRGLNEFELSVISKRCKITGIGARRLVKQFLKRNIRLRRNKNEI